MKTAHRPFLAKKKSKENKKERARNSNNKTKKSHLYHSDLV